jgi:hypothetical protein
MRRGRTAAWIGVVAALLAGGCGDGDDGAGTLTPGRDGGAEGGDGEGVVPPVLDDVLSLAKVLRVRWTTKSTCEKVEGERRTDAMTFAPAFAVPGTDTDYVDEAANENQTYTYRVRCVRGALSSDWSNTLSGNPFIE